MSWLTLTMAFGYFLVLLAIMAFLHGVKLVCQDLRQRRLEQREEEQCEATLERIA